LTRLTELRTAARPAFSGLHDNQYHFLDLTPEYLPLSDNILFIALDVGWLSDSLDRIYDSVDIC
jgi:hypothetical protein